MATAVEQMQPSAASRRLIRAMAPAWRGFADRVGRNPRAARIAMGTVLTRLCPPDRGTRVAPVRELWRTHPVIGEWVRSPGVGRDDAAILYIHGSGYALCSTRTHRGLVSRLSRAAGLPAFSLEYRRAPEHVFPAAANDAMAGYRWLLDGGLPPERIVVAGDSAGGHLAIDLAMELRRHGLPMPAALYLLSPLVDPTYELGRARDRERPDPFAPVDVARQLMDLYAGGHELADPRLSLLNADPAGLPPILLQAGATEMLSADAEAFTDFVNSAGGSCALEIWPGQIHVFQALYRWLPEARAALERAGGFVGEAVEVQTSGSSDHPPERP
jgi:acetyl esterase/lipase